MFLWFYIKWLDAKTMKRLLLNFLIAFVVHWSAFPLFWKLLITFQACRLHLLHSFDHQFDQRYNEWWLPVTWVKQVEVLSHQKKSPSFSSFSFCWLTFTGIHSLTIAQSSSSSAAAYQICQSLILFFFIYFSLLSHGKICIFIFCLLFFDLNFLDKKFF